MDPVSDYTTSLDGLTAGQLEDVARHLQQTYHMVYGMLERQEQLIFRVGPAETQRTEAPAVFLRQLADAVRMRHLAPCRQMPHQPGARSR